MERMTNLHNEEIRAIQMTIVQLRKAVPLEKSQSKKDYYKKQIKELESLLEKKLLETPDFKNFKLEEDVY